MSTNQETKVEVLTHKEELERKLFQLTQAKEELISQLKEINSKLEDTLKDLKVGTYVQNPITKVVYKVVKPNGTFIAYKDIDYVRTRQTLEEKADLSMTEAMEAGFDLGELGPKKRGSK